MSYVPITTKEIKQTLEFKNLAPRKHLGQNFLVDKNILRKISITGQVGPEDLVLEIGSGMGGLTEELIRQAGQVIGVEYDRGLFGILLENFAGVPNLTLINRDILEIDLPTLLEPQEQYCLKVIANLPYYITTPVLFKIIESGVFWERLVLLVQKEVAERMSAQPGTKEYGALTVMLNFYGRVEKIGTVPKTVFYPTPQVDSTIVRIFPNPDMEKMELYPFLRQVVQASFGQRRKKIINALTSTAQHLGSKEQLSSLLLNLGISPDCRGESLTSTEFINLAKEIRSQIVEGVCR